MSRDVDYADMGVDNEHVEYEERTFPTEVVDLLLSGDTSTRLVEQQQLASWLIRYEFEEAGVLATEHDDDQTVLQEARDVVREHLGDMEEVGYVSPDPSVMVLWREC